MRWRRHVRKAHRLDGPRCLRALQHRPGGRCAKRRPVRPDQECRTGADRGQAAGRGLRAALFRRTGDLGAPATAWRWKANCATPWRDGQLDVFYQPIMRLADRTVAGFEALLRWHHPVKGLIAPADFIAHSEETGLIVALGRFALERAAADLAHWQRYFPLESAFVRQRQSFPPPVADSGFEVPLLKTILDGSGIVEGTLNLEVTESAIASDRSVPEIMARIRASWRRSFDRRFRHRRQHPERAAQPAGGHGQDRPELPGPP